MSTYNWQQSDWPHFRYDLTSLNSVLYLIAEKAGQIKGKYSHLTKNLKNETLVNTLIEEAINTSEIEGELLNRSDVRSSIKNKLGLNPEIIRIHDKRVPGLIELMLDARKTFNDPLNAEQLFEWHIMLLSGSPRFNLKIGGWREDEEPMQIVSGHYGKWKVFFEAPPSQDVPEEMQEFIDWFNRTAPGKPQAIAYAPIRAAIAHLYFESIHPFEDGNGRIGRVIAEKALSQGSGYPVLLSLSSTIDENKKEYYAALNAASKSNEITAWLKYFTDLVLKAHEQVESEINFILLKTAFFDKYKNLLNQRQLKALQLMFKEGAKGFMGGMNATKYMNITQTSKATATRDLHYLTEIKIFTPIGGGRSTRYQLNLNVSDDI